MAATNTNSGINITVRREASDKSLQNIKPHFTLKFPNAEGTIHADRITIVFTTV